MSKKASLELVKTADADAALALVTVSPQALTYPRQQLSTEMSRLDTSGIFFSSIANGFLNTASAATLAFSAAILMDGWLFASLIGVSVGAVFGAGGILLGALNSSCREEAHKDTEKALGYYHHSLRSNFLSAQGTGYARKREILVAKADEHIKNGGFLTADVVAYLAAVPASYLKNASNELAITVLQARKMLHAARNGYKPEQGPVTFKKFKLTQPQTAEHQGILLRLLKEQDVEIPEMKPVYERAALPGFSDHETYKKLEIGQKGKYLRMAAAPFFAIGDWYLINKARKLKADDKMPLLKVPALTFAADFSACLAKYEAEVERLDLPAMRGWSRAAKALSAPRDFLPKA